MRRLHALMLWLALAGPVALAGPAALAAQAAPYGPDRAYSRWFFQSGIGSGWLLESPEAFDGGAGLSVAFGYDLSPSTAVMLSFAGHQLHYRLQRLDDLIAPENLAYADELDGELVSVSSGIEWSPADGGALRPLLGLALGYEHRFMPDRVTSPYWIWCGVSVEDRPPGCVDLGRDLDGRGRMTLESSVGLILRVGPAALAGSVGYRHGMRSVTSGLAFLGAAFRLPFGALSPP